jgi:hypothetical protein
MYKKIVKCWQDKCDAMNSKEKGSLLEATQKAFFKEASTKAGAAALALENQSTRPKWTVSLPTKSPPNTKLSVPQSVNLRTPSGEPTSPTKKKNLEKGRAKPLPHKENKCIQKGNTHHLLLPQEQS